MLIRSPSGYRGLLELARRFRQQVLVARPAVLLALQRDEVLHAGELGTDAVHRVQVVGVGADDAGATVGNDVGEVIRHVDVLSD
jgi:hypothetical protein